MDAIATPEALRVVLLGGMFCHLRTIVSTNSALKRWGGTWVAVQLANDEVIKLSKHLELPQHKALLLFHCINKVKSPAAVMQDHFSKLISCGTCQKSQYCAKSWTRLKAVAWFTKEVKSWRECRHWLRTMAFKRPKYLTFVFSSTFFKEMIDFCTYKEVTLENPLSTEYLHALVTQGDSKSEQDKSVINKDVFCVKIRYHLMDGERNDLGPAFLMGLFEIIRMDLLIPLKFCLTFTI